MRSVTILYKGKPLTGYDVPKAFDNTMRGREWIYNRAIETGNEVFNYDLVWADEAAPQQPAPFEIDKSCPLTEGCLDYFPNALAAIAAHSKYGNDKHNAGEPMHWAFNKSTQHADSAARHLVKRGTIDPETGKSHTIGMAWRALALLETELIKAGATPGRGVRQ